MHNIIPGILENDWQEIQRKLEIIRPFSKVDAHRFFGRKIFSQDLL